MTNLLIDISNIFFRSMYICGNGYGSTSYTFDNQDELDKLIRKVSTDISFIIRQVNPSRVIFALDSKSWRKEISIDENEGYKANREKSSFINWNNIYAAMKDFGDILDSNGFIVSKVETAEADDLIRLWTDELLFKQNQHVVIASADEDIRQCIHFSQGEAGKKFFSVVYNPTAKKLYVPKYFNDWLATTDNGDIFNRSIDVDKEDFTKLKEKLETEEVDGNRIGMRKVFCGDDGDNVPPIHTWMSKTAKGDEKIVRVTNSKFEKIVENVGAKDYQDIIDKSKEIKEQLIEMSGNPLPFKIEDRIKRQIKLVVLSTSVFPKHIVNEFNKHKEDQLNRPNIYPQTYNMNSLLSGTRYVNAKNRGNELSIFKETDRLNKELF